VVVGNEKGVVGHGLGKAKEVQEAITKGIEGCKEKPHQRFLSCTELFRMTSFQKMALRKYSSKPAAHGTGVIAGGSMRAVLESAGCNRRACKITWFCKPS
jgi:small subunit ribosomal protein S5